MGIFWGCEVRNFRGHSFVEESFGKNDNMYQHVHVIHVEELQVI
jgi:hypothetical protein